ncbi:MAG: molybdopterin cofactor-binding domain-containing protein, partial [Candidatus Solibacter sp.]
MRRRDFFAVLGGGIMVVLDEEIWAQESGGPRGGNQPAPLEIGAWLHIGDTGVISVYTGKVEVGQNARTSLTQAVLEELHTAPANVKIVMADTGLTPFDIGTVGSMTTPRMWPQIRKAAAAAREMLLDLAAKKWSVDRATLAVSGGKITSGTHSATFGELAKGEKWTRTIPSEVPLTAAPAWQAAGKSMPKVDGRDIVTGAHKYTFDMKRPGMLHAKVLYPPQFGATLLSLDSAAAQTMPGVKVVHEGNFVAVAAPEPDVAAKALAALKAEWKPVTAEADSHSVFQYFRHTASDAPAAANLTAYTIAYIAHVPLEPRAAIAEWEGDKVTVWTGSQRPFGVRSELAQAFKIAEENARVIVPDTGSGYGGKHTGDAAIEAAKLAR